MTRYSRIYSVHGRKYRYNYDKMMLERIFKITDEMAADNDEWVEKFGKELFPVENGYVVMTSIGLNVDSWKKAPISWVEDYDFQVSEELRWMETVYGA